MTDAIAWWGWLLIWIGLVIGLLGMLALFALWLFRKGMVLVDDVANLADKAAVLDPEETPQLKPAIAVLQDMRDIRDREHARRFHRSERRRLRHERRMARARAITTLDASTFPWPAGWYRRK